LKKRIGHNCQSFKKLSEQTDDWVYSTIFLGNRYERRRLTFLISLLFGNYANKPVIYDHIKKEVLIPECLYIITYNNSSKTYFFNIKYKNHKANSNCCNVVVSKDLWDEMIHLKNKFMDLCFEIDKNNVVHIVKQHAGYSCLNSI